MGTNANENGQRDITTGYLLDSLTREQVIGSECMQKLLKIANFLYDEGVFAYNAYFLLQKLSECEQSCGKEKGLSPYLYHMLRKTSTDSLTSILVNAYKIRKYRSKEYCMDLLHEMCEDYKLLFSEMAAYSGFSLQIPFPKLWTTINERFADCYEELTKKNGNDCTDFGITMKDSYDSIRWFFNSPFEDLYCVRWFSHSSFADLRQQVVDCCYRMRVHYDKDGNFHEEDPDWKSFEFLIQFQLIYSGFIKNLLSTKEKVVFTSAAEFEKMIQAIRQTVYQSF